MGLYESRVRGNWRVASGRGVLYSLTRRKRSAESDWVTSHEPYSYWLDCKRHVQPDTAQTFQEGEAIPAASSVFQAGTVLFFPQWFHI